MLLKPFNNKGRKMTTRNIVVVNVPRTEKNVSKFRYLANLVVKVKTYRSDSHKWTQCDICQRF